MATVSTTLKIVLFTPMPSARHRMVSAANPGFFTSVRAAYRRSWSRVSIRDLDVSPPRKFRYNPPHETPDHRCPRVPDARIARGREAAGGLVLLPCRVDAVARHVPRLPLARFHRHPHA